MWVPLQQIPASMSEASERLSESNIRLNNFDILVTIATFHLAYHT